jgi:hypothetical protein
MAIEMATYQACANALIAQGDMDGLTQLIRDQFPTEERFVLHGAPPMGQIDEITHGLYADVCYTVAPALPAGLITAGLIQTASRQHLILGPWYDEFIPFDKGLRFIDHGAGKALKTEIERLATLAPVLLEIQAITLAEYLIPRKYNHQRRMFSSHRYEGVALFLRT